jgi:hypothetical protein
MEFIPRDYQLEISKKATDILKNKRFVYLVMEPRTGKTFTSFLICEKYYAKSVLFITKKKAISSIQNDYEIFSKRYGFHLTVINNESLHTIDDWFDLVICDEAHRLSAFPKPSNTTKEIKQKYGHLPMVLLSGTPASESISQWFYQFWVSNSSPFKNYINFYKWAKDYVNVKKKRVGAFEVNDYSEGIETKILPIIEPYLIKFTQQDAGFSSVVNQHIINYEQDLKIENLLTKLQKDLVIEGKNEVILAGSSVKLLNKMHQIENGTVKFESGNTMTLSFTKADFIKQRFEGKKIAIFYYFIEEFNLLKEVFKNYTTDIKEFNTTDKIYIGQQYSSSMGINLSKADSLIFYNFGYSGVQYIQAIDRLSTINRENNNVYFFFPKGSLTEKIYNTIKKKQTYSSKIFEKDFNLKLK